MDNLFHIPTLVHIGPFGGLLILIAGFRLWDAFWRRQDRRWEYGGKAWQRMDREREANWQKSNREREVYWQAFLAGGDGKPQIDKGAHARAVEEARALGSAAVAAHRARLAPAPSTYLGYLIAAVREEPPKKKKPSKLGRIFAWPLVLVYIVIFNVGFKLIIG
jgi:hypothetical protein